MSRIALESTAASFGSGAREPYARALRDRARTLYLQEAGPWSSTEPVRIELQRFLDDADASDAEVVDKIRGPVLDVGCGPGRMVHAAIMAGHLALGIDISPAAVSVAHEQGLPVLRRSVFHDLPAQGQWGTVLLIDGNIGIGGDPETLLRRCAGLVYRTGGCVVVEAHVDHRRDRVFDGIVVDDLHRESLPFPWAEVGLGALRGHAARAGLRPVREWAARGRTFAELGRA